ncbi:MAG: class I SAM-dependent rRNA methyltransferase [Bdellovibrio sp.]|nr:class I SAM-dependent rRNA methyltransferase [Bdellovibrio sp.]
MSQEKKAKMTSPTVWRLKKGMDRRFRAGHPWVYSNELMDSPKGHPPGALVRLLDAGGKFLAYGFGNPSSLISFRALTRDETNSDPLSIESLTAKLIQASRLRAQLGFSGVSHRICFGEVDHLPGLVLDRYFTNQGQVLVIQAHTAGADLLVGAGQGPLLSALEKMMDTEQSGSFAKASVVLRNDISVRKLEGLESQEVSVLKIGSKKELRQIPILIRSAVGKEPLSFEVDLLEGQKTGFFLDQFGNIELAALRLKNWAPRSLRILDLCCYVGQWGVQLGKAFQDSGHEVHITAVDASATALEFAKKNLEKNGLRAKTIKMDVLKDLTSLESGSFDLVISDPPALIKSRKDIPTGTHAYLQLLTQATRLTRSGGALIACSCSAWMAEDSFTTVLQKAAHRNTTEIHWVGRGTQSADHPMIAEFAEGRYLKGWIGLKA